MSVKVLYIAGWGRSGTTIVDNILNSHDSVFSTGELFYLWRRGLVQRRKCGCGKQVANCHLWREILDHAYGDSPPDPRELTELQRRVTRVRRTPALIGSPLSSEANEYRRIMTRLYHAIADVTGAKLIVDSSKVPSGAALLPQMGGVEPYLLHMVRDPRAVTHSWMRVTEQPDRGKPAVMDQHNPADSTMHWLVWNTFSERLARTYPNRYLRLRYEDFARAPRATIDELFAFTGVAPLEGPFLDDTTVMLQPNHTVSGNPSRFRTGEITLRADERWRKEQPLGPRLAVTAMALPLLHRYGYRVSVGA
ncbi:sulfotransferase [Actinoplanes sp. NPDC051851]|uniref:sulfotransferase n=1 Tax=Actinoplanes sp. NPDC051851 TaxID=3154753 RepID=UPI0034181F7A